MNIKKLIVLGALLCLPYTANADEVIKDMLSWHKVITTQPKKDVFLLVFKNPTVANVKYVAVGIVSHRISYYMMIGDDIQLFKNTKGVFKPSEMPERAKEKIWQYLQQVMGLYQL